MITGQTASSNKTILIDSLHPTFALSSNTHTQLQNSIRHNLSLHDRFSKCPKSSDNTKSSYWRINTDASTKPYVRRRACSMDANNIKRVGHHSKGGGGGNRSSGHRTNANARQLQGTANNNIMGIAVANANQKTTAIVLRDGVQSPLKLSRPISDVPATGCTVSAVCCGELTRTGSTTAATATIYPKRCVYEKNMSSYPYNYANMGGCFGTAYEPPLTSLGNGPTRWSGEGSKLSPSPSDYLMNQLTTASAGGNLQSYAHYTSTNSDQFFNQASYHSPCGTNDQVVQKL